MWITNASKATWYFVLAYTDKDKGYKGLTGFIVPADTPGITVGRKEQNMGQRASDTRGVTFENVEVPAANVLGGSEGTGWFQAMGPFDKSRPFVASASVGVARAAYEHAKAYSLERTTFSKPIAHHQAASFMLADMTMNIQAGRHLVRESAWRHDAGLKNTKEAAFAKAFWWLRLLQRVPGGEALPRLEDSSNLRRNLTDPAHDHQPRNPQRGLIAK